MDNMELDNKYRTPNFSEFVPGFKCQSCFWYFSEDPDIWVDVEFTEELLENIMSLIIHDAYESEFRTIK